MILGIYGASGLGREVYELALLTNERFSKWDEIIFIDDNKKIENFRNISLLTFKELISKYRTSEVELIIAVGEPSIRKSLYKKIISNNFNLTKIIHPDIFISKSTTIAEGVIICNYVSITCDIKIGKNVYVHPMVCIGHDSSIKDHTIISSYVDIAGGCKIGSCTFLGMNVLVKENTLIGNNSIIGMSSVVYRDIPNDIIALGNPARPMKKNLEKKVFK